jgi:glycopeptide antibiotics resistance protein
MARTTVGERRAVPAAGRRLTRALLGYYLGVIAVVTLVPFQFVVPECLGWVAVVNVPDFLANILMFVPFGFLYRLSRPAGRAEVWRALAVGLLASGAIECTQLFEPERYPTFEDIVANGMGALMGAVLCAQATRRLVAPALIGRLSLELPLMGLVYLLVPLLWVGSLSIGDNALRLWMLVLPVLFGGTLLGFVQRHHFGPARAVTSAGMAGAAAAGVLLGAFPALLRAPWAVLALAALAAAVVLRHAARPAGTERRFELPALRTALPFYATYLVACALAPLTEPGGALGVGDPGAVGGRLDSIEILRLLNAAAAFTLLGYMLAELRGRMEVPFRETARRVLLWAVPVAAATRLVGDVALGLRADDWAPGATALWLTLTIGGALYGGWLYHLQRAQVRALVAPPDPAPPSGVHRTAWLVEPPPARHLPMTR